VDPGVAEIKRLGRSSFSTSVTMAAGVTNVCQMYAFAAVILLVLLSNIYVEAQGLNASKPALAAYTCESGQEQISRWHLLCVRSRLHHLQRDDKNTFLLGKQHVARCVKAE